jgi:hypothetical protein
MANRWSASNSVQLIILCSLVSLLLIVSTTDSLLQQIDIKTSDWWKIWKKAFEINLRECSKKFVYLLFQVSPP